MKAWKRLSAMLLVLVMVLALFASCTNPVTPPEDTTTDAGIRTEEPTDSGTTTSDPTPTDELVFKKEDDKTLNFKIVRPAGISTDSTTVKAAQHISQRLAETFGVTPQLTDDWVQPDSEHDPLAVEILVGATNYNETKAAYNATPYGDYSVKAVGNKLVLVSYSDSYMFDAANALVNLVVSGYNAEKGESTLKVADANISKTCHQQLCAMPVYEGGTFYSYYNAGERLSGQNCDEIIIKKTSLEEFENYKKKVVTEGYTLYTENNIADNHFATFTNSAYTLNAGFYKYDKSVRILIEPLAPAVGLESENVYKTVTTSQITMLGLEYYITSEKKYASNGQSFLIRLADGRFIVVDGGFGTASGINNFVNTLKEQSKEYTTTPTIAAWIITHGHGDHVGIIKQYAALNARGIKVEKILANFMAQSERERSVALKKTSAYKNDSGFEGWSTGSGKADDAIRAAANTFKAELHKVHVGQIYYIADAKMEILYTLESFGPNPCNAFNTTSIIIKMTFGGKTTYLSTGDATGNGMQTAARHFGNYLKSDIVQVAHHGYSTWGNSSGTIEAYTKANATLVLWPQGTHAYKKYLDKDYNKVLFTLSNYKEFYYAGTEGDQIIVELPYVYGQSKITVTRVEST